MSTESDSALRRVTARAQAAEQRAAEAEESLIKLRAASEADLTAADKEIARLAAEADAVRVESARKLADAHARVLYLESMLVSQNGVQGFGEPE